MSGAAPFQSERGPLAVFEMKAYYPVLILMAGLAALLPGCATPPSSPAPASSSVETGPQADDSSDDFSADDLSANSTGRGNPAALAHYAAGVSYEWNDDDERAVEQFNDAALADPGNEQLVIKVAQRFMRNNQADKAITVLAKSARRRDASALLLSWLARADLEAGKTNQALAASRLSIRRQPNAIDGYESELEVFFHNNQLPAAVRVLKRAARAVRPDPPALVALANFYAAYLKAQPKDAVVKADAVALLNRIAKLDVASAHLWQTVADLYGQFDEPKQAAAIYDKLLAQTPEPSPMREALHEKLAGIYFQVEDKTNAMRELEAIVRDSPTRYPRAWFFLGELAFDDDKLGEAADDYENALHWDPTLEEAYYKLALVQIELHRTDDAFATIDLARTRFPKTFTGEFYTAIAYLHVKNYTEAIRHFGAAEVIALAGDSGALDYRFYYQFGEACERNQEYKRADEYLQKCIDLNPEFGEALNYLGYMLADRGEQLPRARTLIEKAVKLEPKNGAYLDSLGWVLFKQNQAQQALPWMLKAVQLSPEPDATVLDHLGEVYMALHQPAKAIEAWKQSISIESNPDVKKKLDLYSGGA
jgi:tetratricopeptide (TPR) repeat protein